MAGRRRGFQRIIGPVESDLSLRLGSVAAHVVNLGGLFIETVSP
jgi:hypothetical protein